MPTSRAPAAVAADPRVLDAGVTAVTVEQLDSIEQARLWHELGPVEATRTLVAALRTALLVAEVVEVDRNELLDGVFFLMTPPDRLRWHLGLEPGARLPLRVALLEHGGAAVDHESLGVRHPDIAAAAWGTRDGEVWGVGDDDLAQVVANVAAVSAPDFVSSAYVAMTGTYRRGGAAPGPGTVLLGTTSAAWETCGDTVVVPGNVWATHDHDVAARIIAEGRDAWVRALLDGRVRLTRRERTAVDLGPGFDTWAVTDPSAAPLAQEIMRLEAAPDDPAQPEVCTRTHPWDLGRDGAPQRCGRRHVARRSALVQRLDGRGQAAVGPQTPLLAAADPATRRLAFRWWNQVYRDAVLAGTGAANSVGVLPSTSADPDQEVAWRLREPALTRREAAGRRLRTRWNSLRARLVRPRPGAGRERPTTTGRLSSRFVVEGDVVDIVLDATPSDFARLHGSTRAYRTSTAEGGRRIEVTSLALEVRDHGRSTTNHRKRRTAQNRRAFGACLIVVALVLIELTDWLPGLPSVVGMLAAAVGVGLSVPWGVIAEAFSLAPGRLQATLRIKETT